MRIKIEFKTLGKKLLFLACFMTFLSAPVFAMVEAPMLMQETPVVDISAFFIDLGMLAMLGGIVSGFIINATKATGTWQVVISWVIAIALAVIGNVMNLGFLSDVPIAQALVLGVASGAVSNGLFDIGLIKGLLAVFGIKYE